MAELPTNWRVMEGQNTNPIKNGCDYHVEGNMIFLNRVEVMIPPIKLGGGLVDMKSGVVNGIVTVVQKVMPIFNKIPSIEGLFPVVSKFASKSTLVDTSSVSRLPLLESNLVELRQRYIPIDPDGNDVA